MNTSKGQGIIILRRANTQTSLKSRSWTQAHIHRISLSIFVIRSRAFRLFLVRKHEKVHISHFSAELCSDWVSIANLSLCPQFLVSFLNLLSKNLLLNPRRINHRWLDGMYKMHRIAPRGGAPNPYPSPYPPRVYYLTNKLAKAR